MEVNLLFHIALDDLGRLFTALTATADFLGLLCDTRIHSLCEVALR